MYSLRKYLILLVFFGFCFSLLMPYILYAEEETKEEESIGGKRILGKENILVKEKLSKKYKTIVITDFSLEGASIQEVDESKHPDFKVVVNTLAKSVPDSIASHLKAWGIFDKIIREGDSASDDTVVLEARFTKVTTGSRALRFFVGFGAGSSTVGIEGKLIDKKTGEVLASFENNSHSPASMGSYQVVLPADGSNNAKKIATFIKKLY